MRPISTTIILLMFSSLARMHAADIEHEQSSWPPGKSENSSEVGVSEASKMPVVTSTLDEKSTPTSTEPTTAAPALNDACASPKTRCEDAGAKCQQVKTDADVGNYNYKCLCRKGWREKEGSCFELPKAVESITVAPEGTRAVVRWKPQDQTNDIFCYEVLLTRNDNGNCIRHYKICQPEKTITWTSNVTKSCGKPMNVQVTGLVIQIDNLDPYTKYTAKILAVNKAGPGQINTSFFRTKSVEPTKIHKPQTRVINSTTIEVSWIKPEKYPGPTNYTVDVNVVSSKEEPVLEPLMNTEYEESLEKWKVEGYNNTNCQVSGLKPYTNYSFKVTAKTKEGESEPSEFATATTKESAAGPVKELKIIQITATYFNLTWEKPKNINGVLKAYVIFLKQTKTKSKIEQTCKVVLGQKDPEDELDMTCENRKMTYAALEDGSQTLSVTDLSPFTNYSFTVVAYNGAGKGQPSSTQYVKTKSSESEEIQNLEVTNVTAESFIIHWEPPNCINGILKAFVIYIRYEDKCRAILVQPNSDVSLSYPEEQTCKPVVQKTLSVLDKRKLSIKADGFLPYTNYSVTVVAYNDFGKGQISKPYKLPTKTAKSEEVQNLEVTNVTAKSFIIHWEPPNRINGILKAFVIYIRFKECNEDKCRAILVQPNSDVSWYDQKEQTCKPVDQKTLSILGIRNLSIKADNVLPYTNYGVTVVAYNDFGKGEIGKPCVFPTKSAKSEEIQYLEVTNVTAESFRINWEPPNSINGILKAYVIYIRFKEHNDDKCRAILVQPNSDDLWSDPEEQTCKLLDQKTLSILDKSKLSIKADKFLPYTNYSVTVVAYNDFGKGQISQPYLFPTGTAKSEEIQYLEVTNVTAESFIIHWEPPNRINGILKAYVIYIRFKEHNDDICRAILVQPNSNDSWSDPEEQTCKLLDQKTLSILDKSKLSIKADKFLPYTNYSVTVVAYNDFGKGQISQPYLFPTGTAKSEEIQNLEVTNVTAISFRINWEPPNRINGILKAYVIYIRFIERNEDKCRAIPVQPNSEFQWCDPEEQTCELVDRTMLSILDKSELSIKADNFLPYTNYSVTVVAYNDFGKGQIGKPYVFPTEIAIPNIPSRLECRYPAVGTLNLVWRPPTVMPGPTQYIVTISESEHAINTNNDWHQGKDRRIIGYNNVTTSFTEVKPHWNYYVTIKAWTEKGESSSLGIAHPCLTLSTAPGKVENITIDPVNGRVVQVKVLWSCPTEENRHGEVEKFMVETKPMASLRGDISLNGLEGNTTVIPAHKGNDKCKGQYSLEVNVVPEIQYNFKINSKVKDVEEYGPESSKSYTVPPGLPPPMSSLPEAPIKDPKVPKDKRKRTSFDVVICARCLLDNSHGYVVSSGIIVCAEEFCNNIPPTGTENIDLKSWKNAKDKNFRIPFVVRGVAMEQRLRGGGDGDVRFRVGNDTTCNTLPDTSFCNGPLPSDTTFKAYVYSCTKAGCSVSKAVGPFITAAERESPILPTIAGVISGVVCAALIGIVVFIIRRRYYNGKSNRQKRNERRKPPSAHLEFVELGITLANEERPLKICDFARLLQDLQESDNALAYAEFEELVRLSPTHPIEAGQDPQNKSDNRWTNIIPFDHSRVQLNPDSNLLEGRDYINANFIPGQNSAQEYIATQGPLSKTVPQFWTMVWQQNISVIVMLSDFQEPDPRTYAMREKVARYYLDEEESSNFKCGETLEVKRTGKVDNAVWEIRTLKLSHLKENKSRFVKHFFFKKWTDHAADISPANLLEFVSVVREETKQKPQAPLLVHCSAGVGRTGTFLAADHFTNFFNSLPVEMEESEFLQTNVDVFGRVLQMRNYRRLMVQTKVQYIFIYQVVHELIKKKMRTFETDGAHSQNIESAEDENEPIYANISVSTGNVMQPLTDAMQSNDGVTEEYTFIQDNQSHSSDGESQSHQF